MYQLIDRNANRLSKYQVSQVDQRYRKGLIILDCELARIRTVKWLDNHLLDTCSRAEITSEREETDRLIQAHDMVIGETKQCVLNYRY